MKTQLPNGENGTAQGNSRKTIEQLHQLVRKHEVCYEVWPEYLMVQDNKVQVGFGLELCGTHGHKSGQRLPGCPQCQQTFEDLRHIANWIMPREERASRYDIQPYDRALREAPKRGFRPEVNLTLKILHREGGDLPVDPCEELCLKEMRGKLAELGVPEGHWRSGQDQPQRPGKVKD
jgi:hypothetical protein